MQLTDRISPVIHVVTLFLPFPYPAAAHLTSAGTKSWVSPHQNFLLSLIFALLLVFELHDAKRSKPKEMQMQRAGVERT